MHIYDIAVIGGGASGSIAAIRAGELKKDVVLIERNDSIGKKILLTGKGRCNITNIARVDVFIKKFGSQGEFLRSALFAFSNEDLIDFFKSRGLELKVERQGRVFPATDKARSVIEVLEGCLKESSVKIIYKKRIIGIKKIDTHFQLDMEGGESINTKKVILATGGASYKATGSTGDGFNIAETLSHKVAKLKPALVPLRTKETWVKSLQGVALENIRITIECGRRKMVSEIGELMFTHFGVSGPLVLDLSGDIISLLEEHKELKLFIDLKPGLKPEQLETRLLNEFKDNGGLQLKNIMKRLMPQRLIDVFLKLAGVKNEVKGNQISQKDRRAMRDMFKAFPLTIIGSLPIEEAMVTGGGVSVKDINPRTMESRVVPGLYFAGEIIEGSAASGGYNLQQAFSTGYLAGEKAANA